MRGDVKFRFICFIYFTAFLILSLLEVKSSVPDAFVLFTVSLCFALTFRRGRVYAVAASVLSIVFAAVSLMAVISSIMLSLLSTRPLEISQIAGMFEKQLGVLGFISAPFLINILKNWRGEPRRGQTFYSL